ncbi:MAG: hypothetical protein FD189_1107 [Elusimicrobia bacterium]|nr:MAG: hypothetical protein FD189_1107 [Elusimicrobiota bacterium]
MPLSGRSGQSLVNSHLLWMGIAPATATSDQRATALAELQDAYNEMQLGVWFDEKGVRAHHVWSWLHPTSVDLSVAAQGHAALTHQDIVFTAADAEAAGNDVAVTISAGAGALVVAENTTTKAITITLAAAGNTTAQVVAGCAGLTVATVTGGSATAATVLAATHLELAISGTAMPSGFGGLAEEPRFQYDGQDSKSSLRIDKISPEEMDLKIRDWNGDSDDPQFFCIRPKALSATLGSLYEMVFMPPPAAALTVALRHKVEPGALADSASAYAVGNAGIELLIVSLAKANKERSAGQVSGPERQNADRLFGHFAEEDARMYPVESRQESYAEENGGLGT